MSPYTSTEYIDAKVKSLYKRKEWCSFMSSPDCSWWDSIPATPHSHLCSTPIPTSEVPPFPPLQHHHSHLCSAPIPTSAMLPFTPLWYHHSHRCSATIPTPAVPPFPPLQQHHSHLCSATISTPAVPSFPPLQCRGLIHYHCGRWHASRHDTREGDESSKC